MQIPMTAFRRRSTMAAAFVTTSSHDQNNAASSSSSVTSWPPPPLHQRHQHPQHQQEEEQQQQQLQHQQQPHHLQQQQQQDLPSTPTTSPRAMNRKNGTATSTAAAATASTNDLILALNGLSIQQVQDLEMEHLADALREKLGYSLAEQLAQLIISKPHDGGGAPSSSSRSPWDKHHNHHRRHGHRGNLGVIHDGCSSNSSSPSPSSSLASSAASISAGGGGTAESCPPPPMMMAVTAATPFTGHYRSPPDGGDDDLSDEVDPSLPPRGVAPEDDDYLDDVNDDDVDDEAGPPQVTSPRLDHPSFYPLDRHGMPVPGARTTAQSEREHTEGVDFMPKDDDDEGPEQEKVEHDADSDDDDLGQILPRPQRMTSTCTAPHQSNSRLWTGTAGGNATAATPPQYPVAAAPVPPPRRGRSPLRSTFSSPPPPPPPSSASTASSRPATILGGYASPNAVAGHKVPRSPSMKSRAESPSPFGSGNLQSNSSAHVPHHLRRKSARQEEKKEADAEVAPADPTMMMDSDAATAPAAAAAASNQVPRAHSRSPPQPQPPMSPTSNHNHANGTEYRPPSRCASPLSRPGLQEDDDDSVRWSSQSPIRPMDQVHIPSASNNSHYHFHHHQHSSSSSLPPAPMRGRSETPRRPGAGGRAGADDADDDSVRQPVPPRAFSQSPMRTEQHYHGASANSESGGGVPTELSLPPLQSAASFPHGHGSNGRTAASTTLRPKQQQAPASAKSKSSLLTPPSPSSFVPRPMAPSSSQYHHDDSDDHFWTPLPQQKLDAADASSLSGPAAQRSAVCDDNDLDDVDEHQNDDDLQQPAASKNRRNGTTPYSYNSNNHSTTTATTTAASSFVPPRDTHFTVGTATTSDFRRKLHARRNHAATAAATGNGNGLWTMRAGIGGDAVNTTSAAATMGSGLPFVDTTAATTTTSNNNNHSTPGQPMAESPTTTSVDGGGDGMFSPMDCEPTLSPHPASSTVAVNVTAAGAAAPPLAASASQPPQPQTGAATAAAAYHFSLGLGDTTPSRIAAARRAGARSRLLPRTHHAASAASTTSAPWHSESLVSSPPQSRKSNHTRNHSLTAAEEGIEMTNEEVDYTGRTALIAARRDEAKAQYMRGDYAGSIHTYTDAIELLKKLPTVSKHDDALALLLSNRAAGFLMLGALETATQDCHIALQYVSDPQPHAAFSSDTGYLLRIKLLTRRGRALLKRGMYLEAVASFEQALNVSAEASAFTKHYHGPEDWQLNINNLSQLDADATLGKTDAKRLQDLVDRLEECLSLPHHPHPALLHNQQRRMYVEALGHVSMALQIASGSVTLLLRKLELLAHLKRWREAAGFCERFGALQVKLDKVFCPGSVLEADTPFPDVPPAQHLTLDFFGEKRDEDSSTVQLKLSSRAAAEAVLRLPYPIAPFYLRALRLEERYPAADAALTAMESLVMARSKEQQKHGAHREAALAWLPVERAKLDRTRSGRELGDELFRNGDYERAAVQYANCLKIDGEGLPPLSSGSSTDASPNSGGRLHAVLHCNRAACLMAIRNFHEAIEECTAALRIHSRYMKAILRRARCYVRLQRNQEAIAEYNKWLQFVDEARKSSGPSILMTACLFDGPADATDADITQVTKELDDVRKAKKRAEAAAQEEQQQRRDRGARWQDKFPSSSSSTSTSGGTTHPPMNAAGTSNNTNNNTASGSGSTRAGSASWRNNNTNNNNKSSTSNIGGGSSSAHQRRDEWFNQQNSSRRWDSFKSHGPRSSSSSAAGANRSSSSYAFGGGGGGGGAGGRNAERSNSQPRYNSNGSDGQQHQHHQRQNSASDVTSPGSDLTVDHYTILLVASCATEEEIKKSYRQLARQYHPDKNKEPGAVEKFRRIQMAYEVLNDAAERRRYDMIQGFGLFSGSSTGGGQGGSRRL